MKNDVLLYVSTQLCYEELCQLDWYMAPRPQYHPLDYLD
jgi:hypothetical protein